jgi:hypothetical protein
MSGIAKMLIQEPSATTWIGIITVLLIIFDFVARLRVNDYASPMFFDSLVTLAVGYWFGARKG